MKLAKILREGFLILLGSAGLAFFLAFGGPWYLPLLGIGLVVWGIIEIYREVRDSKSNGEVSRLKVDREEIQRRLGKEE